MADELDYRFLRFLRIFSIVEGISTLILFFVAMPLKYYAGYPMAVTIFGSIHGLLFMGLVGLYFVALDKVPISTRLMIAGVVGAIVPFGPFVVDIWLGRLAKSEQTQNESSE